MSNNDTIKNLKECTPEYVAKLREYLLQNANSYFRNPLNEATSFADFERFSIPYRRRDLCLPNEVLLIDRTYDGVHQYVICKVSKTNRVKELIPVVKISELQWGDWRNGYFLLPRYLTPNEKQP